MITRRAAVFGSLLAVPALASAPAATAVEERLRNLEEKSGGRLGVAVLDSATGRRTGHRADERFALCSTFKLLAAASVLARVDRGDERLDRRVVFAETDLVTYSPRTKDRVGLPGMMLSEICEAALTVSDNTAGNLLLDSFGGPAGLTAYARAIGDEVTRLDRRETELNEATPGDPRDTTTPAAMLRNLDWLVLGAALSGPSRTRLIDWLLANKTGGARLRAGFPKDWRLGGMTGSGSHGATNHVAVVWPPDRAPIVVAAYYAESLAPIEARNAVLAEVGRIIAEG